MLWHLHFHASERSFPPVHRAKGRHAPLHSACSPLATSASASVSASVSASLGLLAHGTRGTLPHTGRVDDLGLLAHGTRGTLPHTGRVDDLGLLAHGTRLVHRPRELRNGRDLFHDQVFALRGGGRRRGSRGHDGVELGVIRAVHQRVGPMEELAERDES